MSALFICTKCGSEARIVRTGQELDGTAKAVRCIVCGAVMSEAGPWGTPASILRGRATAKAAARIREPHISVSAPNEKTRSQSPEPAPDGSKPRRAKRKRRVGPKIRRTQRRPTASSGNSDA